MRVEREIGTRGAFNGSEEKPAVLDSRSCFGKRKACEETAAMMACPLLVSHKWKNVPINEGRVCSSCLFLPLRHNIGKKT